MKVYLLSGVPASGKSWVCSQLEHKFNYIPHDKHYQNHSQAILKAALEPHDKPILADCPFAERLLRETLEKRGVEVTPVFIVERPEVIKYRYETRAKPTPGRAIPKGFLTRADSIEKRADEWKAFKGTSDEVLKHLLELVL